MRAGSLTRLRIAFVLLGAALLAPLFFLLRSMESRLETQRKLRHEIVAERIFDEMERELTSLLAREGERPSDAYDATETRTETWAPFVVGYFTRDSDRLRVIARDQLTDVRSARVERAVEQLPKPPVPEVEAVPSASGSMRPHAAAQPERARDRAPSASRATPPPSAAATDALGDIESAAPLPAKTPPEAVLRQLNRGADERDQTQRKVRKAEPVEQQRSDLDDPLSGRL
ncbi:MAG TPA: hypothetical protein VGI70_05345 [Polyangiales bacterium]|jgi:hypothetical protein